MPFVVVNYRNSDSEFRVSSITELRYRNVEMPCYYVASILRLGFLTILRF
jgi:hypothetical protein